MSRINIHNYEAFLLDYSEGTLNAQDLAHLKTFVLEHPELNIDLDDFDLPSLSGEDQSFELKNSLKKNGSEVPDEELLHYLEGNLSHEQKLAFTRKLNRDKELNADFEAYKKTVLQSDHAIIFEAKSGLKRTEDDLVLNDRLIAHLENQLSASEKTLLEKELSENLALQKSFALLSSTILSADSSLVYPDKEGLKKANKVIALFSFRVLGSLAASLLLLIGFAVLYNFYGSQPVAETIAVKEKITNPAKELNTAQTVIEPLSANKLQADLLPAPSKEKSLDHKANLQGKEEEKQKNEIEVRKENSNLVTAQEPDKTQEPSNATPKINEVQSDLVAIQTRSGSVDSMTKQNYLLVSDDLEEDESFMDSKNTAKKNLWKRAVQLAKQANRLGVKSVDGDENSENKYRLSFNSFSVEKK